jgi:tRNA (uracil-5-)-methyltransferase
MTLTLCCTFRDLNKSASRNHLDVYDWVTQKRCIEVDPIVAAPSPLRNKCEFTFGYRYLFDKEAGGTEDMAVGEYRSIPAVGFMVTGWAGGVSRPHCCDNIPSEVCKIVDVVDEFLSTSPLSPYDPKLHQGMWRFLTIRSSRRTQECMIIVVHSPASGAVGDSIDYSEHFECEKKRLVSVLAKAKLPVPDQDPLGVTSIFFQEYEGLSNPTPDHPVQVSEMLGGPHLSRSTRSR